MVPTESATKQPRISWDEVRRSGAACRELTLTFLGARVIIADYNMTKGHRTVKELSAQLEGVGSGSIRLMECDLRSLDSVRRFAQAFLEQENCLDVLICNAGIAWSPTLRTADGFHTVIQVNYLSHFLLTTLLLDTLKATRASRIVFVTSGSHRREFSLESTQQR